MTEFQWTLTAEERECLGEVLETALKETRREEHRTRAPLYREHVLKREELILGVLNQLRSLPSEPATLEPVAAGANESR